MDIIGRRKIFYFISGAIIVLSLISIGLFRFQFGIDFVGGTFWEVRFPREALSASFPKEVKDIFTRKGIPELVMQPSDETSYHFRFKEIDEPTHQEILKEFRAQWQDVTELRFETVGPTIGATLRTKAIQSIAAVLLGISLFIAWAFRKVSRPLSSWKYGVATILTLFHDVIVPVGLFSLLGKVRGVEIDSNFIVALLVVMGFSVHDTIVVFDRIRENLRKIANEPFGAVVNRSVNETLIRSLNTSLTTLLALFALYLWGSANLQHFVLAMIVGILAGTYSSIFIASPILVDWEAWQRRLTKR